jgi:hypothetical protein
VEVLTCWSRLPENTQTIKTNTAPLNKAFGAINGKRLAFRGGGLFAWDWCHAGMADCRL